MKSRLWRSLLGRVGTVCLAAIFMLGGLSAHSPAARADALSWAPGTTVSAPPNAGSQPDVVITSISCPAAGNCTAIGSYQDSAGDTEGLLATESGGRWSTPTAALLPFNADAPNPGVSLTSVSCATAGNCTAIGSYLDVHGYTQGLLLIETGGTWAKGKEVIYPQGVASVAANPQVDLTSVSCATATNCLVAGTYSDSHGYPQGMLETEINGAWSETQKNGAWSYTGVAVGLVGDAATEPHVTLTSVSCGAVGRCVAVGSYVNTSHEQEGLLLTGVVNAGAWVFTPSAAGLPPGAAASPVVSLNSVSCRAAGECDVAGSYADSSHHQQGLLLTQTGSVWQSGTEAMLPSDASSNPNVSLTSVSCSSVGNCDAVGDYGSSTGNLEGLMLTATGGTWGTGSEPTVPADAGSSVYVMLLEVSCYAVSTCAATGNYADDSFSSHPLLLSQSANGTWSAGIEPSLAYLNAAPDANVEVVSCPSGGGCTALADYTDQAGNQLAGAVNGTVNPAATPAMALNAPPSLTESGIALPAGDFGASLSAGNNETGQVTFQVFGPQNSPPVSCASGGTTIAATTVSGDGGYAPAQGFTPVAPGDYWWYASYGGDLANAPAATSCGPSMDETVVQTPTLTVAGPSAVVLNTGASQASFTATLGQVANAATGTVAFTVFGPESVPPTDCSTGGTPLGLVNAEGNGSLTPAGGYTPTAVGDYWWYASYSGDASDPSAASPCGNQMAETVVKAPTTLSLTTAAAIATVGVPVNSPVAASLHGGVGETGTVRFSAFGPQASPPISCSSPTITVGSAAVQADGVYAPGSSFTPTAAGTYWWYASYSGDAMNTSAASACGVQMPEMVVSSPAVTKTTGTAPTTTPTPTPTPTPASAATPRIANVTTAGNVVKVTVACRATSHQSCAGALKATTTEPSAVSKTTKKKASDAGTVRQRVVTIATVSYKVGGGKTRQVSIRLNRLGVQLLASRRKLSAILELHEERTTLSRTVTMHLPARDKARRKA